MTIETKLKKHYKWLEVKITSGSTTIEETLYQRELETFRDELRNALEDVESLIEELTKKELL